MTPKFKTGDTIINEDGSEERTILGVGKDKYFVTFPDGTENVSLIATLDKYYEAKKPPPPPDGILCRSCKYVGADEDYEWRKDSFGQRFIKHCPKCKKQMMGFICYHGGKKMWAQG